MSEERRRRLDENTAKLLESGRDQTLNAILATTMQDVAGLLDELLTTFKSTIPSGTRPQFTIPVGPAQLQIDPMKTPQYMLPWMAFTMFNDGPAAVYHTVNADYLQLTDPLNSGDQITIDMKTRQISKIIFVTKSGSASVRLFATK